MVASDTVLIAAITALAGLGSALIGARTANRRAEETFTHERLLRDEDRVRSAIDTALDVAEEELALLLEIHAHLAMGVRNEEVTAMLVKVVGLEGEVGRKVRQLMLRLHRRDQIVMAVDTYRTKLCVTREWLTQLFEKEAIPEKEKWSKTLQELADCHAKVLDITAGRLGSMVADE